MAACGALLSYRNNFERISDPQPYLYQVTDLKSKRTVKEIVDGQQRKCGYSRFFRRPNKDFEIE